MPSGVRTLDISVGDERVWLVGLVAMVVLAGAVGFAWVEFWPDPVEIAVEPTRDGDFESASVTVERLTDGGPVVVEADTVTPTSQLIYTTGEPGRYRVSADVAGMSCQRTLRVHRTDGGLEMERLLDPGQRYSWACSKYVTLDA